MVRKGFLCLLVAIVCTMGAWADSTPALDRTGAPPSPEQLRGLFPRIDRVAIDPHSGAPAWINGDLGQLPRGEIIPAVGAVMDHFAVALRLTDADNLKVVDVVKDDLGMRHVRLNQYHRGLPVDGGDLWVHADADGILRTFNGHVGSAIGQAPVPAIDSETALRLLASAVGADPLLVVVEPELVYMARPGQATVLTWKAEVQWREAGELRHEKVFVDAVDGAVRDRQSVIRWALNRRIYTANYGSSLPGTLMFSEGGSSTDTTAMGAYTNSGNTYNYYKTKFNRDSYNNAGAALTSTVHYQSNYNNAFWNGSQMVYGDGDGSTFSPIAKAFDVVAHELTHAVTEYTGNMNYSYEPGALNEAMSDIFAAGAEAYVDGSVNADTWKIGEDCYTPSTAGDALRYMNNPTADGQSYDYYPERYTGTQDYGGVHLNSGIGNLAFYLVVSGGTHPRGKTTVNVPGIGMAQAEQIFYRALANYMTTTTNFEGARNATAQAATDLYGASASASVHAAWDAVGVPGGAPVLPTALQNNVAVGNLSASTGTEKHYYLDVPAGASNLVFQISGGTGDADLYVKFGSQPTTSSYDYRPYLNGNNETVTATAATAGRWYVMIRAYSTYSGLTLKGSYTAGSTNQAPTANFTFATSNLTATFTDTSTDSDGTISAWSWSFGDGSTSTLRNPSRTYAAAGTYTVTLTVTDDDGATASKSASVTVSSAPSGPIALSNGVAVGNLAASTGQELHYYLDVPSGSSNLVFQISGGTGDADMYVKLGSQPTTSSYDYRPYLSGNNETVNVATATAGRWYVMVRAYSTFSGVTLKGSFTAGGGGGTTTTTTTGTVSARQSKYYNVTVSGGVIDLNLTWNTTADLDLYLYNPAGTLVKSATSTAKPEVLSYNTNGAAGTYRIRVYDYSYSTSATFTLTATYQP